MGRLCVTGPGALLFSKCPRGERITARLAIAINSATAATGRLSLEPPRISSRKTVNEAAKTIPPKAPASLGDKSASTQATTWEKTEAKRGREARAEAAETRVAIPSAAPIATSLSLAIFLRVRRGPLDASDDSHAPAFAEPPPASVTGFGLNRVRSSGSLTGAQSKLIQVEVPVITEELKALASALVLLCLAAGLVACGRSDSTDTPPKKPRQRSSKNCGSWPSLLHGLRTE
jgi:hypothetical protein